MAYMETKPKADGNPWRTYLKKLAMFSYKGNVIEQKERVHHVEHQECLLSPRSRWERGEG